MAQLPLIMIGRLPVLRKYPALGNVSLPGKVKQGIIPNSSTDLQL